MISSDFRDKILQVVEGSITIEQLEEWLVPRLPVFLTSPDSTISDIVAIIELGLAEMSDGVRTKDEFLELLQNVAEEQETILTYYPPSLPDPNVSGSSNETTPVTLDFTTTVSVP